eukprot:Protomagalhaensia_sp_Gyna_25__3020@NODE_2787_length_889_cov_882_983529_g406_i2_p1_GENE_NODE_2787_length_889_cov_882_983529_g406_i2NODE_2787_length_889_cov_882_983529_g406_i2_p1_ORF_typecomplete_len219_score26_92_NODE_2787_length_889_cov_882_983529_g406_i278659
MAELSPNTLPKLKTARFAVPVATTNKKDSEPETEAYEFTVVDRTVLSLWLRRAQRKFRNGVTVIKVTSTGKLVKRQFYIGAKPEYIELISSKLFDIAYHITDVTRVELGSDSPDFEAYRNTGDRQPKAERSLIIYVSGVCLSLVFISESDRRDAQFLLRVERRATINHYRHMAEKIRADEMAASQVMPTVKAS